MAWVWLLPGEAVGLPYHCSDCTVRSILSCAHAFPQNTREIKKLSCLETEFHSQPEHDAEKVDLVKSAYL